jgi:hypothetical protein
MWCMEWYASKSIFFSREWSFKTQMANPRAFNHSRFTSLCLMLFTCGCAHATPHRKCAHLLSNSAAYFHSATIQPANT